MGSGPQQPTSRTGSRERAGAWLQTPLATAQGTPSGKALPPTPQRATPDRKRARCGVGAGPFMSTPSVPGTHAQRALAARAQRRAGRGTAPGQPGEGECLTSDPFTTSQGTPPGGAPRPPSLHATPACRSARCGAGAGSPMATPAVPRTHGQQALAAGPQGRAAERGTVPDNRRLSPRRKVTPTLPD